MKLNDYQVAAMATAVYPDYVGLAYTSLGLAGEAGEPQVLYEIDWGDGSKMGGRYPVDIGKEWDVDDARERVAVIVAALLGDDENVS